VSTFRTDEITPGRLPAGFQLRRRVEGTALVGFTGPQGQELTDQVTLIHTRGRGYLDSRFALTVHVTSTPAARLFATEGRAGISVDIGIPGAKAVYHDGWWTPPETDGGRAVWGVGTMHSITVYAADRVLGVRAPRNVGLQELLDVAKSILQR
jgi:hypothetical protein